MKYVFPEIDECSSNPCPSAATCEDDIANYTCICPAGFTGELCDQGSYF